MKKKTVFSGIQPSGNLHIGNYLGAISQWVEMQTEYNCIFCVVDYHAITVKQDPKVLKKKVYEVAKTYLASGLDPEKVNIFLQSDVPEHTELAWILNTIAKMSDLFRMTQFKDKSGLSDKEDLDTKADNDKINRTGVGIFDYPVLMAADILLYNTDVVPVGEDQAQHVELTRELARRFNKEFGPTFKEPEVKILKEGARIMGLDDPSKKMSKSASSAYNYISLVDEPGEAAKKIMKAVTDSGKDIVFDRQKKPAIANLLTIYSLLTKQSIKALENKYTGKGYGEFKKDLAEIVKKFLEDIHYKYKNISDAEVQAIFKKSADNIRPIAKETLRRAKEKMGIL